MNYRYKNFITKEEIVKRELKVKRNSEEILLFMLIANLILVCVVNRTKALYDESLNTRNIVSNNIDKVPIKTIKEDKISNKLKVINQNLMLNKCSNYKYENNKIKLQVTEENVDILVNDINGCKDVYIESIDMIQKYFVITLGVK